MEDNSQEALQQQIQSALANKEIPHIYFNGVTITSSSGDMLIILKRNNESVAVLNVSYTMAKTLSTNLGALIANFEDVTENPIMTTKEIEEKTRGTQDDKNE